MTLFGAFGEKLSVRSASKQRGGERERERELGRNYSISVSLETCVQYEQQIMIIYDIYIYMLPKMSTFSIGDALRSISFTRARAGQLYC